MRAQLRRRGDAEVKKGRENNPGRGYSICKGAEVSRWGQNGTFKGSKTGERLQWTWTDEIAEVGKNRVLKSQKDHAEKSKFI